MNAIGDRERTRFQETGEIQFFSAVPLTDILAMLTDLGFRPDEIEIVGGENMFSYGFTVRVMTKNL